MFWMGANRQPRTWYLPREKWFWEWTDGSNWKYTKWAHGEPNGYKGSKKNFYLLTTNIMIFRPPPPTTFHPPTEYC